MDTKEVFGVENQEKWSGEQENIYRAIFREVDCMLLVNNGTQTYRCLKITPFWEEIIGKSNTLSDLYYSLFVKKSGVQVEKRDNKYKTFIDESFFQREKYLGELSILNKEGEKEEYGIVLMKLSGEEAVIFLFSISSKIHSEKIEYEKMDTLQEQYLFSMIGDLHNDTCINPNTTEVNAARQDYINLKYSDWRMKISNMFLEADREIFLRKTSPEYVINTLEEQVSFQFELLMLNMDGKYIWVRFTFTRMKNFSRENARFVFTVTDINEDMLRLLNQKSIIKAVEEQNKKLQDADKEKTKYFSSMSHEIRTPINAILGMNEVILRETKEENIKSYANDIKNASRMDYSKIEAGKMEIVPVEYQVSDMIKNIYKLILGRANEKSLEVVVKVGQDMPEKLYGDEIRITQIILNLLVNAIKYTDRGTVTFSIMPTASDKGQFALAVCVEDTGIGIKKEDLEKLCEEYTRFDSQKNRNVEGTGLGMNIVVGLLTQMGSNLEVESTYGEGSKFSFVLPQKIVSSDKTTEISKEELNQQMLKEKENLDYPGKKVLIVDDNIVNLKVASALLKPYQVKVDLADSGKACLDKLNTEEYDLILLDHMMPGMDGIETLNRIREKGDKYSRLAVIALTANSAPGLKDNYVSLGFTDYLEKPVMAERLDCIIRTYL